LERKKGCELESCNRPLQKFRHVAASLDKGPFERVSSNAYAGDQIACAGYEQKKQFRMQCTRLVLL
jgi:hypothetical protein